MPSNDVVRAVFGEKLSSSLEGPIPHGTPRTIAGRQALPGKATAVIGMRRAGKTTYLHQVRGDRLAQGIPRDRLPYVNFEDERLSGTEAGQLHLLLEEYYRRHPEKRGKERVTWCLDEIQEIPGWESFVRRMLDTEEVEIFLSGSSATLLSREVATAMRGRGWEVVIFPFSFGEYLTHHQRKHPHLKGRSTPAERSRTERSFLDYVMHGGFPEAQGLDDDSRRRLLNDYVDIAILRDIVERHEVTNVTGLRWLVRHLLGNAGALFSVEKFYAASRSQGLSISKDTIHQLLAHLEDCFLVRTVSIASDSERRRMVNPRKAYPVDPGLIPIFDRSGKANVGHALETTILIELQRRRHDVHYVRTTSGLEVDFLTRAGDGSQSLIQVCFDISAPETLARELRALEEAHAEFPEAEQVLLTLTHDRFPASVPAGIRVEAAYEWILRR